MLEPFLEGPERVRRREERELFGETFERALDELRFVLRAGHVTEERVLHVRGHHPLVHEAGELEDLLEVLPAQVVVALRVEVPEVTGLDDYFDEVYTSHEVGYAKEDRSFWEAVSDAERFDPATTVFVDDTVSVLASARGFGMRRLVHVTRPDTGRPARGHPEFASIESVAELVAERREQGG